MVKSGVCRDSDQFTPGPRIPPTKCAQRWGDGDKDAGMIKSDDARARVTKMDFKQLQRSAKGFYPIDVYDMDAPTNKWWNGYPPVIASKTRNKDLTLRIKTEATPIEYWATRRIRECAPGLQQEDTRRSWHSKNGSTHGASTALQAVQTSSCRRKKGAGDRERTDDLEQRICAIMAKAMSSNPRTKSPSQFIDGEESDEEPADMEH